MKNDDQVEDAEEAKSSIWILKNPQAQVLNVMILENEPSTE